MEIVRLLRLKATRTAFVRNTSKWWFCCVLMVHVPEPAAYWDLSSNFYCRRAKMACRLETVGKLKEWFGLCLLVSATVDVGLDDGLGSRRKPLGVTWSEDVWVNQLCFYLLIISEYQTFSFFVGFLSRGYSILLKVFDTGVAEFHWSCTG